MPWLVKMKLQRSYDVGNALELQVGQVIAQELYQLTRTVKLPGHL